MPAGEVGGRRVQQLLMIHPMIMAERRDDPGMESEPGGPAVSAVFGLADRYVDDVAALDPIAATYMGVAGHDDRLTDFSPEGTEERAALDRQALVDLAMAERRNHDDELAAAFQTERLGTALALVDADEPLRAINNLASPVQAIRDVFDLMALDNPEDWEAAAHRMAAVPDALAGLRRTWDEGRRSDLYAARRQAVEVARQASIWSGATSEPPFFVTFAAAADSVDGVGPTLRAELDRAAASASEAYGELAVYLRDVYAPEAPEADGVGSERYTLLARSFLGADIDLAEAYRWGWDELGRIEADMVGECARLRPGASIAETVHWLEHDSDLALADEQALRRWLQELMDAAIRDLDGTHFDIAPPVRTVEAMIAPPGGAAAMYYTPPSEDFSRPGRTWYPSMGLDRYPLWGEVTTAYHEGVPGHHLQCAQVVLQRERLSRVQRMGFISGHGEGWALYAERLMDELGYLDRPEYRMGMLAAQALRAVRVIIDIGMHLELEIPATQPGPEPAFHAGERWTPELGRAFLYERSRHPEAFMASEIVRYLGWPGQAISYKVGERVWRQSRADAQVRHRDRFDLKAFHAYALDLGPLGLDLLADELARF
jgi:uncharacterized protein (DUF885 family)